MGWRRRRTEEAIKVMQAWLDGAEIEHHVHCWDDDWSDERDWHEEDPPTWDWHGCDYRVSPEQCPHTGDRMSKGSYEYCDDCGEELAPKF